MKRNIVEGFSHDREDATGELIGRTLASPNTGESGLAGGRNGAKNHVAIGDIAWCLNAYSRRAKHKNHATTPDGRMPTTTCLCALHKHRGFSGLRAIATALVRIRMVSHEPGSVERVLAVEVLSLHHPRQ